ncbi:MAG: outer membrane protein [Enterobacteriaceae bacterium]
MKQKIMIAALGSMIFALPAQAQNMVGIYVKAKLGVSVQKQSGHNDTSKHRIGIDSKNKSVVAAGLSVGYDLAQVTQFPIRVEYEYTWRGNGKISENKQIAGTTYHNKSEVRTQTHMTNALYDFDLGSGFRPYVQAGIGIAHHKYNGDVTATLDGAGVSGDDIRFAWGVGAGVAYQITPAWSVDVGYRYLDAGKISVRGLLNDYSMKAKYHDFMAGVRYSF